jgi:dephospho-CoA kinase
MKKIGITGGIGSGKSTVCSIFQFLGFRVYVADDRAKWLMNTEARIIKGVKTLFGEKAYLPNGQLDRAFIGGIVFQDPDKLHKLNALVHPETVRDFADWFEKTPAEYDKPFVLKEAAILFESGTYKGSDGVITVYAPKSLRLQRVLARDKVSEADVLNRMERQWPDREKIRRADFTIFNDGKHSIIRQVLDAIRFFEED